MSNSDDALDQLESDLQVVIMRSFNNMLSLEASRETAEAVVEYLENNQWVQELEQCEFTYNDTNVQCESDAPAGHEYCEEHGGQR